MGRASKNFLQFIRSMFAQTTDYAAEKGKILKAIFYNFEMIYSQMVSDPNYKFYAFASNLINFGNEEFKPYLLEANGCFRCYSREQNKPEFLRL